MKALRLQTAGVIALAACLLWVAGFAPNPTRRGIDFGTSGHPMQMDFYGGEGVGLHPIAIEIGDGRCAEFLTHAGYNVFAIAAPAEGSSGVRVEQVQRAIRYVRFHSREWRGEARQMVLVDDSRTYVGVIVGLLNGSGVMGSDDSVDRESARVRAVVMITDPNGRSLRDRDSLRATLDPLIAEKQQEAALGQPSAGEYVNPDAPAFLLVGQPGEANAFTGLADTFKQLGIRCDVFDLGGEWEQRVATWLDRLLGRSG
jgi:hypothetical protein